MPVLVTAAQLRAVLGVPNTLYDDTALNAIIDTAEDAIGDFLVQHKVAIEAQRSESTTSTTLYATQPHKFYVGQTVTISGVTGHNGSKVVADIVDIYTFKINKVPKEIYIRYGCELETCFIMDCNSKGTDKSESNELLSEENWTENVIEYLTLNIIPYLKKEFLNRFRYAFVKGYHEKYGVYLDLKNGKVLSSELKDINEYETLVFSPDGSIECDDDTNAIPCEIISPVLSSINEIKILYEGLMTETCQQANRSMGFHVNVSAVDENEKMIK
jgi:hypothetical protein